MTDHRAIIEADALLDQLGAGVRFESADDLIILLTACRDDVDAEPLPAPIPRHVIDTVLAWRRCA